MPGSRRLSAEAWAVFLALNAGLDAAAALLAHLGRFDWRWDVLSHFALMYAAGAGALMVLALPLRRRARLLVLSLAAVAMIASAALIAPEYLRPEPPRTSAAAPGQIKIIQYNALRTNADINREAAWIVAQRPDFVTIQEARHDLRDRLVKMTGWRLSGAAGDQMIFSRAPRITMHRPDLGPDAVLHFVNATYPSASGPLEIVTVHIDWPTSTYHPS